MSYLQRHKYLLLAFLVLVLISGTSGYFAFTTHKSLNTTQNHQSTLAPENFSISAPEHLSTSTEENVTQNFSFDHEANQNNLNTQTNSQTPDTNIQTPNNIKKINIETTSTESMIINPTILTVSGEEYTTEFKEGTTVYELMQNLSASSVKPFSFSGKDYGAGMGYFVTEINGVKNDPQTGKYWIYYINGQTAQFGISSYIINKGDKIEWKYENSF